MRTWCLVIALLWATSASAFVSRLHPNGGGEGPIPCNSLWAAVVLYIQNIYQGGELVDHLEARYLTPDGPQLERRGQRR